MMNIFARQGHDQATEVLATAGQNGSNLQLLLGVGFLLVAAGVVTYLLRPKNTISNK